VVSDCMLDVQKLCPEIHAGGGKVCKLTFSLCAYCLCISVLYVMCDSNNNIILLMFDS